ncbi:MAG: type II toxin-antitoxin system RelE/ParE family toxin [Candidatus Gracilibacteria bacterium]|nr:type II toxin-antitoxin system RelE/ParE family toxin [Candidatus Gracilibacteria bacterium]
MYKFIFTKNGKKSFDKLENNYQDRVIKKLTSLKESEDIFVYLKKLENLLPATHRLRVGNIRIILEFDKTNRSFYVLDAGNRGDIYK